MGLHPNKSTIKCFLRGFGVETERFFNCLDTLKVGIVVRGAVDAWTNGFDPEKPEVAGACIIGDKFEQTHRFQFFFFLIYHIKPRYRDSITFTSTPGGKGCHVLFTAPYPKLLGTPLGVS